ncbi:MAG TPA: hypothetical protein VGV36_04765 [Solirubrobacteraceae bacterium]|nr:hypothetical protein [Solirubrobacteraceae bacterium]
MRPLTVIGAILALVGLALLAYGLLKATPLVSFGTSEELRSERAGRQVVYIACAVLVVAAASLAPRIGDPAALVVAAPGLVCALLVLLALQSAYGVLAFVAVGPVATLVLPVR